MLFKVQTVVENVSDLRLRAGEKRERVRAYLLAGARIIHNLPHHSSFIALTANLLFTLRNIHVSFCLFYPLGQIPRQSPQGYTMAVACQRKVTYGDLSPGPHNEAPRTSSQRSLFFPHMKLSG